MITIGDISVLYSNYMYLPFLMSNGTPPQRLSRSIPATTIVHTYTLVSYLSATICWDRKKNPKKQFVQKFARNKKEQPGKEAIR